ncbi:MAG: sulfurtransferase [Chromatiales bacterium]|nr:sulfurtransferase [Chromatiales bacterium]
MSQINRRDSRSSLLMSVEELADALHGSPGGPESESGLVVVDCRFNLLQPEAGRAAWLAGHIPGAFYADLDRDLSAPRRPDTGRHPLPDPEQLRTLFSTFGIGKSTLVVAYDEGGGGLAARLWWLLRWMGHARVVLLDGGFAAWQSAGLPVSRDLPASRPGRFQGAPGHMPVRDASEVAAGLASDTIRLLDMRAEERFLGHVEPIDPVAGHVPGAVNAPFGGNLTADNRFQPGDVLARRYAPLIGDRQPGEIVCMCGSGVTACHGIFALELAGRPGAALYPGSWSEWIRSPDRPVAGKADSGGNR